MISKFIKQTGPGNIMKGPPNDPSYPQSFNLPWNFADNETKMILGGVEHTIVELTATALKLRYSFEDAGVICTEEDSYEH